MLPTPQPTTNNLGELVGKMFTLALGDCCQSDANITSMGTVPPFLVTNNDYMNILSCYSTPPDVYGMLLLLCGGAPMTQKSEAQSSILVIFGERGIIIPIFGQQSCVVLPSNLASPQCKRFLNLPNCMHGGE